MVRSGRLASSTRGKHSSDHKPSRASAAVLDRLEPVAAAVKTSGPQGRLVEIRGNKKRWHYREPVSLFELDRRDIAKLAVESPLVLCRCSGYADLGSGSPCGRGDRRVEVGIIRRG